MLTEIYIEALLVDEELADMVWEAWDRNVFYLPMVSVLSPIQDIPMNRLQDSCTA